MTDQRIYLKNIPSSPNNLSADYEDPEAPASGYQKCHDASITFTGAAGDWVEITLDTPFPYNGTDNLVIYYQNHDGSRSSPYPWFFRDDGRTVNSHSRQLLSCNQRSARDSRLLWGSIRMCLRSELWLKNSFRSFSPRTWLLMTENTFSTLTSSRFLISGFHRIITTTVRT